MEKTFFKTICLAALSKNGTSKIRSNFVNRALGTSREAHVEKSVTPLKKALLEKSVTPLSVRSQPCSQLKACSVRPNSAALQPCGLLHRKTSEVKNRPENNAEGPAERGESLLA